MNAKDYNEDQLAAWAPGEVDIGKWDRSFRSHYTLVATYREILLGFADMDLKTSYLDRLYVHKDYQGQGIATTLCDSLEAAAMRPITVHASITAKAFFEQRGYLVLKKQEVERNGLYLTNYIMQKNR